MIKKEKQENSNFKIVAQGVLFLSIFISQLFFYTWCGTQCRSVGYEITRETNNRKQLIALQNSLKIELARLKSPERIEKIAKKRLGLSTPTPEQMIFIHEGY